MCVPLTLLPVSVFIPLCSLTHFQEACLQCPLVTMATTFWHQYLYVCVCMCVFVWVCVGVSILTLALYKPPHSTSLHLRVETNEFLNTLICIVVQQDIIFAYYTTELQSFQIATIKKHNGYSFKIYFFLSTSNRDSVKQRNIHSKVLSHYPFVDYLPITAHPVCLCLSHNCERVTNQVTSQSAINTLYSIFF